MSKKVTNNAGASALSPLRLAKIIDDPKRSAPLTYLNDTMGTEADEYYEEAS